MRIGLSDLLRPSHGWREPSAWQFIAQSHGKPELAPGQLAYDLRFNISHTKGMVVAAYAIGRDVGIDVEALDRQTFDDAGIADAYFSPSEQTYLFSFAEPGQRKHAFLDLWTAKEAFIKAIGQGLSMPLDCFSVDLIQDLYPPHHLPPEARDRAWMLRRWRTPHHLLALATGSAPAMAGARVDFGELFWNQSERRFEA